MKFTIILLFISSLNATIGYSQTFDSLSYGLGFSQPHCLFYDLNDSVLYAGGLIINLGDGTPITKRIVRWNGLQWDTLGSGSSDGGAIRSIVRYDGKIFVGGGFTLINNIWSGGVATWDGNDWGYFGNFLSSTGTGYVKKIIANGLDLYIGGGFDFVNTIPAFGLARYDGVNFHTYPILTNDAVINAIELYNGELYVGGNFQAGGGKNDIAKFDGTNWVSVGGGLTGFNTIIDDMIVYKNELYISGHFLTSYGDPGNLIAKWNGTTWSSVGSGLTGGNCLDMEIFIDELYVAGSITSAGGLPVNYFAKWDGNNWSSTGGNFNLTTTCLAAHGNDLYIGGVFSEVNGVPMSRITRYNIITGFSEVNEIPGLNIFPNPAKTNVSISFELNSPSEIIQVEIIDAIGKVKYKKSIEVESNTVELDIEGLSDGIYFCKVFNGKFSSVQKLVVGK